LTEVVTSKKLIDLSLFALARALAE
jgi:hypothetical protein